MTLLTRNTHGSPTNTRPHVIIIGGGLSGLCLAHALVAYDCGVTVFERDAGAEVRGQGYRLTIDETGSEALRVCLPQANYAFIRATAGKTDKTAAFVFLDHHARELHRFTFDVAVRERHGDVTGQVDRTTLRCALLSGLQDHVRFGKTFSTYEERPDEVVVHFADGCSARGDILVGADGTHSRVRRQRAPATEPRDSGIVAVFGRTPATRVQVPSLGRLLSNAGIMAVGPRGRVFFCTAMRFREQPAIVAGRFGIGGACWPSEDYYMWAVAVRARDTRANGALDAAALHELAAHAIPTFHDDYHTLIREADPESTVSVPIRVAPPVTPRAAGRVTLIGDAMHTMPPFGAHGANTALKDAQTLAGHLSNGLDITRVGDQIHAFETCMRSYSEPLVKSAVRMMSMATIDLPFKPVLFGAMLKTAGSFAPRR
jgi:2-polyprenyl-6-methoxyphenol hydroxylase-like FAD-dependent oxidoreductase